MITYYVISSCNMPYYITQYTILYYYDTLEAEMLLGVPAAVCGLAMPL